MKNPKYLLLPLIFIFIGCAMITFKKSNPFPNVDIPGMENKTIALLISSDVKNKFKTQPTGGGCKGLHLKNWHTSLKNGFNNAYKDSFKVIDSPDNADYVIKLLRTTPFLEVTTMYGTGAAAACGVNITYKARLLHNGKAIKSSAHTVMAKQRAGKVKMNLKSALESMYEIMTKDFFNGE